MRFGTTNARLTALRAPTPSFGTWVPVATENERTGKALAVWCNSTPVRLVLLNRRSRTLTYPAGALEHLREIRIPQPDSPAWEPLAAAYREVCDLELLPVHQADECSAQKIIDRVTALALDTDEAHIGEWRRKLAREPTVSNKPAQD